MESTKELRRICQSGKVEGRQRHWWYVALERFPSIYLTRFLIPLNVTPNQVTIAGILFGIAGTALLGHPSITKNMIGFLFIYLYIVSDKVDGEIARYQKKQTLQGKYLDEIGHLVIPPLFFLSLGIRFASSTGTSFPLIVGAIALISIMGIRWIQNLPSLLVGKKALKYPGIYIKIQPSPQEPEKTSVKKARGYAKLFAKISRFYHQFQDLFVINALFFIAFLLLPTALSAIYNLFLLYSAYLFLNFVEEILKKYFHIENEVKREYKKIRDKLELN